MSTSKNVTKVESRAFQYRCIKKDFQKPLKSETLVKDFHLERGEKDEVIIVEDRKIDYVELSNRDVNNVGLSNILELARKGAINLRSCQYNPKVEAVDTSMIDTMNPQGLQEVLTNTKKNEKKMSDIASSLGVSVDELISSMLDGSFSSLVSKKLDENKVKEGGSDNA